ncbi:protein phosphatase 2C domain-containing protein [Nocardia puris]|uniref:protein phosphatase 2C domain-containing protein n=1 Tax=Nocardia puris TaxID=208602 RepID=UPI001895970B|nr:protein phosphatase 2C domain-containing protein [Nocardia puris]MBF6213930.1 protein phosphatase 2C domain-containing protein [Nocardia puris]
MIVHSALLPAQSGEDHIVTSEHAVIVLDGATAHAPETPKARTYVETLSHELSDRIGPDNDLREALAEAIEATATQLDLTAGRAPSSTVAIVRTRQNVIDLLVLGDSAVVIGTRDGTQHIHTDDRLDRLGLAEADHYRQRLTTGAGYDDEHRRLLQDLQRAESHHRNRPAGFWIAEADPTAAEHALTVSYPRTDVAWALLATDGAFDVLPAVGLDWQSISQDDSTGLSHLLRQCTDWEATTDPNGLRLPRAKRHDDKAIAILRP